MAATKGSTALLLSRWPSADGMPLPGAKAGRRSVSVRLGEPGEASEEDMEEEPERPAAGREARWARIASPPSSSA